jgi:hypothetical protein
VHRKLRFLLAFALVASLGSAAGAKTFVYVHDASPQDVDDPKIYGFAFDPRSGVLDPVPGSPFDVPDAATDCDGQCQTLAYSPKRKTLVVAGPTLLSSFLVNKDGSLTLAPGAPVDATSGLISVATAQIGKRSFAYAPQAGGIRGYEIGADAALTELDGSPFPVELHSPAGSAARKRFLFVADRFVPDPKGAPAALASFVIGADGTPVAAPGSPLTIPSESIYNVGADTAGRTVYLAADAEGGAPIGVHAVAIDKRTGAPSLLAASPFAALLGGDVATGASVGKGIVAALARDSTDDLALFKLGKGGALTPLGSVKDTTVNSRVHAFGGRYLFVASREHAEAIVIRKRDGAIDTGTYGDITAADAVPVGLLAVAR